MEEEKVKQRWKEYFDNLLNKENPIERKEMRTEEREKKGQGRYFWRRSQEWVEEDEEGKGSRT